MKELTLEFKVEVYTLTHEDDYMLKQLLSEAKRSMDLMLKDLRSKTNVITLNPTALIKENT